MQPKTQPMYTLYYWPIPGRGVFVRSLFAFTNTPLKLAPVEEVALLKDAPFAAQPVPLRAPPILIDHGAGGFGTSQLSAIGTYAAKRLDLLPEDDLAKQTLALKVLSDANDVLAELWRANADFKLNGEYVLWDQPAWDEWRDTRFVRWLEIWEATARQFGCTPEQGYLLGTPHATLADLASWSLWATMARCLPALAPPLEEHGPTVVALCRRLEAESAGLRELARRDAEEWGELYCGGMIEKSIRQVIAGGRDGVAR